MKVKYYDFPEATISDDKIKMVLEPPSIAGKGEGENPQKRKRSKKGR